MYVAGWSFTSRCNLKCIHCYNSSGNRLHDELTTEQAKVVAQKLIDFKVDAVNFGGGECPLRKDFFEICKILDDAGIKLSLTTNGLTLNRVKKHIHLFHDIGVSVDFADARKHDFFRGVKGAYDKAVEAVDYFVKNGINTEIVTCITKLNSSEKELKALYSLATKLGIDFWRLNRYRPIGREWGKDQLELTPIELMQSYKFLGSLMKEDFTMPDPLFAILGKSSSQCPCGKTSFRIQPNGDVSPCIYLKMSGGNILNEPLHDILNSKAFQAIKVRDLKGTKCEACSHYEKCKGGCAGAAYVKHGTFNRPDPYCWHNPEWNVHEKYLCTAYVPIRRKSR